MQSFVTKSPFEDTQQSNALYEELKKGLRPKLPVDYPKELLVLIRNCWDTDPRSRPSFVEVCLQLERLRYKILHVFSTRHQGLQKDKGVFDIGLDFIKTMLEEHSSFQRSQVLEILLNEEKVQKNCYTTFYFFYFFTFLLSCIRYLVFLQISF